MPHNNLHPILRSHFLEIKMYIFKTLKVSISKTHFGTSVGSSSKRLIYIFIYIRVESSRRVDSKLDLESSRVFDSSQLEPNFLDSPDSTSQCRVESDSDSPLTRVNKIGSTRVK